MDNLKSRVDYTPLYSRRFTKEELKRKNEIFEVLCRVFFSRFIKKTDVVLDLGAGYGDFINNISCAKKFAVDVNTHSRAAIAPEVTFFQSSAAAIPGISDGEIDVVFMSNFLEHLPSKEEVLQVLLESKRVLKPGGRLLVLSPNVRYAFREYWDFFDHLLPLSDRSLVEGLELAGFEITVLIPKFLPYTTKSWYPKNLFLFKLYLMLPIFWNLFGAQMFVSAQKPVK